MHRPARLLVVDDDESNRDVLSRRLRRSGYEVDTAEDGQQALELLCVRPFDLVLLDNMMPGLSGVEVLHRLREKYSAAQLPVIMVTAQCESEKVVGALRQGANDYITKPVDFAVALARVETQLAQHVVDQKLRRSAQTAQTIDPVTSLPNRAWLEERLRHIRSSAGPKRALLVVEPDRFERTRESLAPELSQELLKAIAKRLQSFGGTFPGRAAQAARCGEYQFALLMSGAAAGDSRAAAERLRGLFQEAFQVDGQPIVLVPTIGIGVCGHGECGQGLLRDALAALRHARGQGAGQCETFQTGMRERDLEALQLESDLRQAVERGEFVAYYQPKVRLETGHIEGFEALVRWRRPGGGLAAPGEFIAAAEATGLIVPMGEQVLDQACRDTAELRRSFPHLGVSVNISPRQFSQPDLVERIAEALRTSTLPPAALRLEVTESVLIENPRSVLALLKQLHALGVGLKLDDFGTGYSSLSYLHQLPFDTLKIDRSFVARLGAGGEATAIVRAILNLAQTLNMSVVAEGVETLEQAEILRDLGCQYVQGFLFSKPVPLDELRQMLVAWKSPAEWGVMHSR